MTSSILVRTVIVRWLPFCALIILAASCKKYRADRISIGGSAYRATTADMTATDTLSVVYSIEDAGEIVDFEDVTFQNPEATISADFDRVDSIDGSTYLRINYYTRATPTGSYPVKAIVRNKTGAFAEVVTTISVVNYIDLLRQYSTFSYVQDSLDEYPYYYGVYILRYTANAQPLPSVAANAFRFSYLGVFPSFGGTTLVENVTVYVDSLTGQITAPLQQTINARNYKGSGQLIRTDGYQGVRGTYSYDFYTFSGTHYEGRLSF